MHMFYVAFAFKVVTVCINHFTHLCELSVDSCGLRTTPEQWRQPDITCNIVKRVGMGLHVCKS